MLTSDCLKEREACLQAPSSAEYHFMEIAKDINILVEALATKPSVWAVIVSYNSFDDTCACVRSLLASSYENLMVVVVDNNSPDGSGFMLQNAISSPRVKIIRSPENNGFAAGSNIGLHYARNCGAELFWLVNADVTVDSNALFHLVECFANHPECGAVGSKVLYPRFSKRHKRENEIVNLDLIWGAGGKVDFSKREVQMLGWREIDQGQYDDMRECDYLPGCSLMVSRLAIDKIGYLPEMYFMYFEETDWCTRMREEGFKLLYTPGSVVWHDFDEDGKKSSNMVYYYNRSTMLFWHKHSRGISRLKFVCRVMFKDLLRAQRALKAARNDAQREIFRAHRDSCIDFLLGRVGRRRTGR